MDGLAEEEVLFPDLPIIDSHHHIYDNLNPYAAEFLGIDRRFLAEDYAAKIGGGHNLVGSVAIQIGAMYRPDGPEERRPVGETEFLNAQAGLASSRRLGIAAGIISFADFRKGERIRPLLEAHVAAAPDRFKGIRQPATWDADPSIIGGHFDIPEHLYDQQDFREGFAQLSPLGLSFDAFILGPQLPDAVNLARSFPDTSIILNHLGNPVAMGEYAGRLDEEFAKWRNNMALLVSCHNVTVKLGGFGDLFLGLKSEPAVDFDVLVDAWRPYIETAFDLFGADRCMFESNIPTDHVASFHTVCNAFKRLTSGSSEEERNAIFHGTAARVYKINPTQTK